MWQKRGTKKNLLLNITTITTTYTISPSVQKGSSCCLSKMTTYRPANPKHWVVPTLKSWSLQITVIHLLQDRLWEQDPKIMLGLRSKQEPTKQSTHKELLIEIPKNFSRSHNPILYKNFFHNLVTRKVIIILLKKINNKCLNYKKVCSAIKKA